MKQLYQPTADRVWEGRIDDPADPDAFRWHQVVQLIDFTSPGEILLEEFMKPSGLSISSLARHLNVSYS